MLDEPFSALDSHLKGVLEQNLVSLFEAFEGTILYVSHDIDESLRFCDRIAVVDAGRIVEMDRGRELVNRPQSLAGVKLSGCKNATAAVRAGERSVRLPKWGIEAATSAAVPEDVKALGVRAFFLTGGEPLVRLGVVDLVRAIAHTPGIENVSMTTNGVLLPKMAADLKEAGLSRVNISLDTLDPAQFGQITRRGELQQTLDGIDAALAAGFNPVKINAVACLLYTSPSPRDA